MPLPDIVLDWYGFFFWHFKCNLTVFWPAWFLMRNQLLTLLRVLGCDKLLLSCCLQDSLSVFQWFDYNVSMWVPWVYPTWSLLSSSLSFIKFGVIFSHYFSGSLSVLPSTSFGTPLCRSACWCPVSPLGSLHSSSFSFCSSDFIISISLF